MAEFVVLLVDKTHDDPAIDATLLKRGDVISVLEDGVDWGACTYAHPEWQVIRVPGWDVTEARVALLSQDIPTTPLAAIDPNWKKGDPIPEPVRVRQRANCVDVDSLVATLEVVQPEVVSLAASAPLLDIHAAALSAASVPINGGQVAAKTVLQLGDMKLDGTEFDGNDLILANARETPHLTIDAATIKGAIIAKAPLDAVDSGPVLLGGPIKVG